MKYPYILLIIDMQPCFVAANNTQVLAACRREIAVAIHRQAYIVFVEFINCGATHSSLTDLTQEYRHTATIIKHGMNGSKVITTAFQQRGLSPTRLRVCGVNTDACVLATVTGLSRILPNSCIEIVQGACWSVYLHQEGLEQLSQLPNTQLQEVLWP